MWCCLTQLNDVVSLVVALQALKLAESTSHSSSRYSYGWQRAEILGALINGVFLLALCFSIGLEAITRFFNATEITNAKLIVAVGSAGLVSNLVGLILFADVGHGGHSHGGGGHGHSHGGAKAHAEPEAHAHSYTAAPTDRTPLLAAAGARSTLAASGSPGGSPKVSDDEGSDEDGDGVDGALLVHPGEFREHIVKVAHDAGYGATANAHAGPSKPNNHGHAHGGHDTEAGGHDGHDEHAGTGPSEGSMNMRGVFLHVLGDALGNVGVIASGLFIWLTDYSWRFYFDPAVSLVITCIIFSSALPLVKSASFILLQGVPNSISLDKVRAAIVDVEGVINVHELHVWALSETKSIASVHILTKSEDFVAVSKKVRRVMHRFGIHSSTIQPEIVGAGHGEDESHISATQAASLDVSASLIVSPLVRC